ncbi:hypothetical protein FN846DRAFT_409822 [Sphaerosporella brunnea]|uniref:Uncharacterized protein n=1 Tax=Sphaerosporella brunnea TaxID=1250544 RepID=A0A5J5EII7_9PEZI|nr:hypothetical protein FN846DRAFT_409822 [Sphaerosporella brunnea]
MLLRGISWGFICSSFVFSFTTAWNEGYVWDGRREMVQQHYLILWMILLRDSIHVHSFFVFLPPFFFFLCLTNLYASMCLCVCVRGVVFFFFFFFYFLSSLYQSGRLVFFSFFFSFFPCLIRFVKVSSPLGWPGEGEVLEAGKNKQIDWIWLFFFFFWMVAGSCVFFSAFFYSILDVPEKKFHLSTST